MQNPHILFGCEVGSPANLAKSLNRVAQEWKGGTETKGLFSDVFRCSEEFIYVQNRSINHSNKRDCTSSSGSDDFVHQLPS